MELSSNRRLEPDVQADRAPAWHADCLLSARCPAVPPALVAPGRRWLWLHYGPIGPATTRLGIHTDLSHQRPPPPTYSQHGRREPRTRRALLRPVETRPEHRLFGGYHLILLALDRRPGDGVPSRAVEQPADGLAPVLYAVAGCAYRAEDGPFVRWLGPGPDGRPDLRFHLGGARPDAAALGELDRAEALLLGRAAPLGRPSLAERGHWRPIAEHAHRLHAEHPYLTWTGIAQRLDVPERTLRAYRRLWRREQGTEERP